MSVEDRARWNAKYRDREPFAELPSPVLVSLARWLPLRGRALDLAGGTGADAVWLARRGLDTTLVDISDVALERAQELARRTDVALVTERIDLQTDPPPPGPWDLVTCSSYLEPAVWRRVALAPQGTLVWVHPTEANLERHRKPSARYLLAPGQGRAIIDAVGGLAILHHREAWIEDRHLSLVVARRR